MGHNLILEIETILNGESLGIIESKVKKKGATFKGQLIRFC